MDLGNAEDTLLGVLLSARTRDVQVLKLFPAFRKRFPNFRSLAASNPSEIEKFISTIGLYKSKARALHGLAQRIIKEFDGKVPDTMEALTSLPGVGRKTANCVLSYVYHQPAIAVDTHVFRITHRLGWTKKKTPEQVERELQKLIPKNAWSDINTTMVPFGRDICRPGVPQCWRCPVREWCAYPKKTDKPSSSSRPRSTAGEGP